MAEAVSRWPRRQVAAQVRPRIAACGRAHPQPLRAPSHAYACIPRPFLLLCSTLICEHSLHGFLFPPPRPSCESSILRPYPRLIHASSASPPTPPLPFARAVPLPYHYPLSPSRRLRRSQPQPSHSSRLPGVHAWNPFPSLPSASQHPPLSARSHSPGSTLLRRDALPLLIPACPSFVSCAPLLTCAPDVSRSTDQMAWLAVEGGHRRAH